jgi:hypothetical protein
LRLKALRLTLLYFLMLTLRICAYSSSSSIHQDFNEGQSSKHTSSAVMLIG